MKSKYSFFAAILFFLIATFQLSSQQISNPSLEITPSTPEAAAFQKYGNIPIGEFSGTASINIPIYELKLKEMVVPVSLSYITRGIKVDEISSTVGLGWVLNAGGNITRNIRGKDDFGSYGYVTNLGNSTAIYNRYIARSFQEYTNEGGASSDAHGDHDYGFELAEGTMDGEPDLFSYSLPNSSGNFTYNHLGQIKPIPFRSIKISELTGNDFMITDEKGNKFYFETNETSFLELGSGSVNCNITSPFTPEGNYTSLLYLSRIETVNGELVQFNYENVNYDYTYFSSEIKSIADKITSPNSISKANSKCILKNNVAGKRLTSIVHEKTSIEFEYSVNNRQDLNGSNALHKISLKYNNQVINDWTLNHSYFTSTSGTGDAKYRLKLDSITENGKPPHVFDYESNTILPYRDSFARDHWGYYNGENNNTTLVPEARYRNRTVSGADRSPNPSYVTANILKKVTYPLGGHTEFTYEPNEYFYSGPEVSYVDHNVSLSVNGQVTNQSQIITIPQGGSFADVIFNYTPPPGGLTPGDIILASVTLVSPGNFQQTYELPVNSGSSSADYPNPNEMFLAAGDYEIKLLTTTTGFVGSLNFHWTVESTSQISSNKIGGGVRVKKLVDKSELGELNFREYKYHLPTNTATSSGFVNFQVNYFSTHQEFRYGSTQNSLLVSEYFTRKSNNTSLVGLVQGNYVGYEYVQTHFGDLNGILGKRVNTYSSDLDLGRNTTTWPFFPPTIYDWLRGRLLKTENYENDGGVFRTASEEEYFYEVLHDKFDKNSSLSNENIIPAVQSIIYAPALYFNGIESQPETLWMGTYHNVSGWFYLKQSKKKMFFYENGNKTLETIENFYYDNPGHAQLTRNTLTDSSGKSQENVFYYPDDISSASTLPGSALSSQEYAVVQQMKKSDQHLIAYPIQIEKKVDGTAIQKIRTIYSDWGNYLFKQNRILMGKESNALYSSYVFNKYDDKGNLLEFQQEDGMKVTLIWGYDKQYVIAKIENADFSEVASALGITEVVLRAYNENNLSQLDGLRNHQNMSNALVTTYTYDPLVGVTSIVNPRGYKTTYEYDSNNRLEFVKDSNGNLISENKYNYKN
ncbi:RHS repeat protein [Flagellimonas hymeniacidonis]|uniref:RHS repeat protein n=1 Tax=Flagellimonas hymeniacidonis TaxID=2603628 RepID=A0A5C8V557_9FLAO|nr:RHS repeat domain-containing protein [Flagellimonas hymeniacidonis]TXN36891.1 RHS repeat protein [Flagellimonas hymeniacidonis]